ncbi:MAG TPA: beta-galactosidase [Streptosporangiaceae bacterium]|nr:beta-galactosidase [Streptosporangiaceae bacterium]
MSLASRVASAVPVLGELRVARPGRQITREWSRVPVEPAGSTLLGLSFRPLQAREFGLDPQRALAELLAYPFPMIRLAAYWEQIEAAPGEFDTAALDRQLDAAAGAGKQVILCVGAVKAFGYPEFFVPAHYLPVPLPEGQLIGERAHRALLDAAVRFVTRIVERYRGRPEIAGWQVEHDAVDPLGMEHSWRLAASFVAAEVAAVRAADETRPVVLNGFLPTSSPVRLQQQWRTRDQGDSLAVAARFADVVGLDFYPRHGLARLGPVTAYLAGSNARWVRHASIRYCRDVAAAGRRLIVAEGQAEPWETVTTPPSMPGRGMFSCLPEHVVLNYNSAMRLSHDVPSGLWAYLFWGAEYWLLRERQGDGSYLRAFSRVLEASRAVT